MKRYYFNGNRLYDLGESHGAGAFDFLYDGTWANFWYGVGCIVGFVTKFAAGFGIGLLIKGIWCAISKYGIGLFLEALWHTIFG